MIIVLSMHFNRYLCGFSQLKLILRCLMLFTDHKLHMATVQSTSLPNPSLMDSSWVMVDVQSFGHD